MSGFDKLGHIFCAFHNDFIVCEIFILLYQDTFHGKDTSAVWKYNHKKLSYANYEIKASQAVHTRHGGMFKSYKVTPP